MYNTYKNIRDKKHPNGIDVEKYFKLEQVKKDVIESKSTESKKDKDNESEDTVILSDIVEEEEESSFKKSPTGSFSDQIDEMFKDDQKEKYIPSAKSDIDLDTTFLIDSDNYDAENDFSLINQATEMNDIDSKGKTSLNKVFDDNSDEFASDSDDNNNNNNNDDDENMFASHDDDAFYQEILKSKPPYKKDVEFLSKEGLIEGPLIVKTKEFYKNYYNNHLPTCQRIINLIHGYIVEMIKRNNKNVEDLIDSINNQLRFVENADLTSKTEANNKVFPQNKMEDEPNMTYFDVGESFYKPKDERIKPPMEELGIGKYDEEFEEPADETIFKGDMKQFAMPKRKSVPSKGRQNREFKNILENLEKYNNLTLPKAANSSINMNKFMQLFMHLIINGNYRIKYISQAATRLGALAYESSHLDENGIPKYRLLPTNSKDPLDNDITDLNGDQVDDVILVDKNGIPSIINGYKLVFASPYKKVWLYSHSTKEERLREPFNVWMNNQFNKSMDPLKIDWEEGKYKLKPTEDMKKLTTAYVNLGLGKPKVSKRLSINGYWSSLFSHLWKVLWNDTYYNLPLIKSLFKYLEIANAAFAIIFDIPAKQQYEENKADGKKISYEQWLVIKKHPSSGYKEFIYEKLQLAYKVFKDEISFSTNELKNNYGNQSKDFIQFVNNV